ncbi:MAG: hypothetical protein QXQ20_08695 [Candidatus Nezhaarchaeales archaeon]
MRSREGRSKVDVRGFPPGTLVVVEYEEGGEKKEVKYEVTEKGLVEKK